MTIFDSSEFYHLFLVTTILLVIIGLMHHLLTLQPYPPIFGVYRQKAFAFHVKKYIMRILLKYRKTEPIRDEDADKPQPLSDHPLVSVAVAFSFFNTNNKGCPSVAGIWRGLFQYELVQRRSVDVLNGQKEKWPGEYNGLREIVRIQPEFTGFARVPRFVLVPNGKRAKWRKELLRRWD